jgi:hypothetical protein
MECEVIYLDGEELNGPPAISWPELEGMKAAAGHYLLHGTKSERRLARRLAHAAAWIEAEAKAIQQNGPVIQIEATF